MAYNRRRGSKTYGDPNTPMSDGTRDFLKDLLETRDVEDDLRVMISKQMTNGLKQGTASGFIKLLQQLPEIEREGAPTSEGYYRHDGTIYKVRRAKAGHLYAMAKEDGRWEFIKGAFRKLAATDLMTPAQVKRAGL